MTNFYKYLKKGKTKDEALRQAKLEYLETADYLRAHPFFWATYVSVGDNSKIKTESNFFTLRSIVLIFLIACVLAIIGVMLGRKIIKP